MRRRCRQSRELRRSRRMEATLVPVHSIPLHSRQHAAVRWQRQRLSARRRRLKTCAGCTARAARQAATEYMLAGKWLQAPSPLEEEEEEEEEAEARQQQQHSFHVACNVVQAGKERDLRNCDVRRTEPAKCQPVTTF